MKIKQRWECVVFGVMFTLFAVLLSYWIWQDKQFARDIIAHGVPARAVVVDEALEGQGRFVYAISVVEFTSVEGTPVQAELKFRRYTAVSLDRGDVVEVIYHCEYPNRVVAKDYSPDSIGWNMVAAGIFALVGIPLMLAGLFFDTPPTALSRRKR